MCWEVTDVLTAMCTVQEANQLYEIMFYLYYLNNLFNRNEAYTTYSDFFISIQECFNFPN